MNNFSMKKKDNDKQNFFYEINPNINPWKKKRFSILQKIFSKIFNPFFFIEKLSATAKIINIFYHSHENKKNSQIRCWFLRLCKEEKSFFKKRISEKKNDIFLLYDYIFYLPMIIISFNVENLHIFAILWNISKKVSFEYLQRSFLHIIFTYFIL